MSRAVRFTDAARWQLCSAVEAASRQDVAAAGAFLETVRRLARDGDCLEAEAKPLTDFPALPQREVRVGEYRIFLRRKDAALWITGVWKAQSA